MISSQTKTDRPTVRTILHPTDFSERSAFALRFAGALAKEEGSRLVLLHVLAPAVIYDEMGPVIVPFRQGEEQAARTKLEGIAMPGVQVEYRMEVGDAAQVILDVTTETKCDLVVMGTHGRTGLGRLLLGSVAEEVMRKAPCPVLTVKMPFLPNSQEKSSK